MSIESFFALFVSDLHVVQSWKPAPRPMRSYRSSGRRPKRGRLALRRSFAWSGRLGKL